MCMASQDYSVEICRRPYTPEIAAGIGRLMPQLDGSFSDTPITPEFYQEVADSDYHDRLIAVRNEIQVIGAATLTIVLGDGMGRRGQLEDFVVDEAERGTPLARDMVHAMYEWADAKGVPQGKVYWQTETYRPAAIGFYNKVATRLEETITYEGKLREVSE